MNNNGQTARVGAAGNVLGGNDNGAARHSWNDIKASVRRQLLESIDREVAREMTSEVLYVECSRKVDSLVNEQRYPLSLPQKDQLLREVMNDIFGWGPLEEFLRSDDVSDILVNGAHQIYVERRGVLEKTNVRFQDDEQLLQVVQRIGARVGRRIDESSPMLDARLGDGSRVNAVIPPISLSGPVLSIRRFGTIPIDMQRLIEVGTLAEEMALFLKICVRCKLNILISGGTGTGKTTFLNVLSKEIPDNERVITIEDAAELQLQRQHVVRLETRPANVEGKGEVTQRDLLRNALRMRPDRIVIGEVRGGETIDMLQAMDTGHEGSMTTIHANNPREAFRRIDIMVSMSGLNIPPLAVRQQTASALNVVLHLDRLTGGRRKLVSVNEITGMEGDTVLIQEIFRFRQTGLGADGHAYGCFEACGVSPQIMTRLAAEGFKPPEGFFAKRILNSNPDSTNGPKGTNK